MKENCEQVTIVVADDQEIVRKGVIALLEASGDVKVVGEASNGEQALVCVETFHPDVLLLDIMMPRMDGFDTLKALRERGSSVCVLMLSMFAEVAYSIKAQALGANGYILKDAGVGVLREGIRSVVGGEDYYPEFTAGLDHGKPQMSSESFLEMRRIWDKLTDREKEIVEMVGEGLMNKEIAIKLGLSVRTVEVHVYNFMKKLNLRNRTELIKFTLDHRLVFSTKRDKQNKSIETGSVKQPDSVN